MSSARTETCAPATSSFALSVNHRRINQRYAHWLVTAGLALAVVPLARHAHLPLHYSWLLVLGWMRDFSIHAVLLAAILYFVCRPREFWQEIKTRRESCPFPWKQLAGILAPVLYFTPAFLLVLTYNDLIAALRFDGSGDRFLARMDSLILAGGSVVSWSHWTLDHHPGWFGVIEFVYILLFPLVGACIVLLGAADGVKRSMEFVGTILTAYYISLLCFFFIPATGPYLADHSSVWPKTSQIYSLQAAALQLMHFQHGFRPTVIGSDYFMAFPCMHLVQPLVMIWFFRKKSPRLAFVFGAYAIAVIPCILILEEHYIVDLIAAIPVAAMALSLVGPGKPQSLKRTRDC